MPEIKELAEKLEAEATRMGQYDAEFGGPRDTSEFYSALARVALEYVEEKQTASCPEPKPPPIMMLREDQIVRKPNA
jgi:hypothetical protein